MAIEPFFSNQHDKSLESEVTDVFQLPSSCGDRLVKILVS